MAGRLQNYASLVTGALEAAQGPTISVLNPATRQLIASVAVTSPEQVDLTVQKAKAVFDSGEWSRAPAHARAKVLSRLSSTLGDRVADLAQLESEQTGRTLREMKAQLGELAGTATHPIST